MTESLYPANETYSRNELFLVRKPQVSYSIGNYVLKKRVDNVAKRAKLRLRATGALGSDPISIIEEQSRALLKRRMLNLENIVEDSKTQRYHVYKPIRHSIQGPYTVKASEPARIQKVIYNGKEIFFGITKENNLVVYSMVGEGKERQMAVHAIEKVYDNQNNTAYLKNKARQTLLALIKKDNEKTYNFCPVTESSRVRKIA